MKQKDIYIPYEDSSKQRLERLPNYIEKDIVKGRKICRSGFKMNDRVLYSERDRIR